MASIPFPVDYYTFWRRGSSCDARLTSRNRVRPPNCGFENLQVRTLQAALVESVRGAGVSTEVRPGVFRASALDISQSTTPPTGVNAAPGGAEHVKLVSRHRRGAKIVWNRRLYS
jgi:hypothetical protein